MCFVRISSSKRESIHAYKTGSLNFLRVPPHFLMEFPAPPPLPRESQSSSGVDMSGWFNLRRESKIQLLGHFQVDAETDKTRQFFIFQINWKEKTVWLLFTFMKELFTENANIELAGWCSMEEKPRLPERIYRKEYLGKPHPLAMSLDLFRGGLGLRGWDLVALS